MAPASQRTPKAPAKRPLERPRPHTQIARVDSNTLHLEAAPAIATNPSLWQVGLRQAEAVHREDEDVVVLAALRGAVLLPLIPRHRRVVEAPDGHSNPAPDVTARREPKAQRTQVSWPGCKMCVAAQQVTAHHGQRSSPSCASTSRPCATSAWTISGGTKLHDSTPGAAAPPHRCKMSEPVASVSSKTSCQLQVARGSATSLRAPGRAARRRGRAPRVLLPDGERRAVACGRDAGGVAEERQSKVLMQGEQEAVLQRAAPPVARRTLRSRGEQACWHQPAMVHGTAGVQIHLAQGRIHLA
eukprot:scaffold392_cov350-Prasinococcus_capsulatus_cf.AAC.7